MARKLKTKFLITDRKLFRSLFENYLIFNLSKLYLHKEDIVAKTTAIE